MLHCRIRTKVQFPNFCASNKKLWGDTEWATNPWPNPVRPHCQAPPRAQRPILWQQLPPTGTSGSAMENLGYLFVCLIDMLNSTNISLLKIVASKVSWSNMPLFKWEIIQPMWNKWFTTRGPPAASDSPLKCSMLICCFSWFELKTKPKKKFGFNHQSTKKEWVTFQMCSCQTFGASRRWEPLRSRKHQPSHLLPPPSRACRPSCPP